jgi:hypothetical protein
MTNPTLERAARAVDVVGVDTALERAAYAAALADGVSPECDSWIEYIPVARAVLMAVRMPEFPAFTALIDGMLEEPETEGET